MNYWRKVFVSACIGVLPLATIGAASAQHSAKTHSVNNNHKTQSYSRSHSQSPSPYNSPSQFKCDESLSWHATLAAYLWAISMQGTLALKGHSTDVSESFSDLLSKLESAGMFWVSVGKGRFGVYFNGMYTKVSSEETAKLPLGVTVKTKASDALSIFAAGVTYIAFDRVLQQEDGVISRSFIFQPYFGVRNMRDNISLEVTGLPIPASLESDVNWVQPLLGARFIYQFNKNGRISLAADAAYASSKNNGFNAAVLLGFQNLFGYQPLGAYLGYRYLHQHYQQSDDQYKFDMSLYGPVLGIAFSF